MYSYFEDRNRFHNTFGECNMKYECVKLPSLLGCYHHTDM